MLKAVTLKEIEKIFEVLDALGISREAVIIPLRPEHPGRVSLLKDGKLEIVVERDQSGIRRLFRPRQGVLRLPRGLGLTQRRSGGARLPGSSSGGLDPGRLAL